MDEQVARFVSDCEHSGEQMMERLSEIGADLSRTYAPAGKKDDPRTRHLKDSITASHTATTAHWEAKARHSVVIEEGGEESLISGRVNFFWEKEGRDWVPGDNIIHHPPTLAKPYLRPAYNDVMQLWQEVARIYYPQ